MRSQLYIWSQAFNVGIGQEELREKNLHAAKFLQRNEITCENTISAIYADLDNLYRNSSTYFQIWDLILFMKEHNILHCNINLDTMKFDV